MTNQTRDARDRIAKAVVFGGDQELEDAARCFLDAREQARRSAPTVDSLLPISITHEDDEDEQPGFDANGSEAQP